MKKDINIPEVKNIHVVAVLEEHPEYHTMDWNAYIINNGHAPIEMVLIVSKGSKGDKITAQFRHQIQVLPAKSFAKIEFLEKKLLKINNQFSVTYFQDNKLFEKTYLFKANALKESNLKDVPVMTQKGVFGK